MEQGEEANDVNFSFIQIGEIINNLKPVQWLIKDYLEEHTLSELFGDPASGKSFIAIDKACCIATGTPYHGHDVRQGAVFYIAGEVHNGLGRRFKAWAVYNDVTISDAPLYVASRPAQLYDDRHALEVAQAVQELANYHGESPAMIVIDTLSRNFGDGDENTTQDMNIFVQNIDYIKDQWQATALIVHHTGHAEKSRARGSMALKGALDHEYKVEKNENIVTLQATKTKEHEAPPEINFEIETVTLLIGDDQYEVDSAALKQIKAKGESKQLKLSPTQRRARETLVNLLGEKGEYGKAKPNMPEVNFVRMSDFKRALDKENIVNTDKPDNKRRGIDRVITELENRGSIRTYENRVWLADNLDNSGRTKSDSGT